jgi:formylglycine-generating enzyme required for sulfatase activity
MVGLHYGGTTNPSATSWNSGKRLAEIARRSRILASVVAEQRQGEEAGARAASGQAEIERRAQAAEIERLRAQLDAERARVAALPPVAAAPRAETPADWAAAEAALGLTPDRIREMQRSLGALGHDPRGVDGNLGAGTRAAIRSWQKSRGMRETGYVSGDLLRSLDEARNAVAAAVRPPTVASPPSPVKPAVGVYPAQDAAMRPKTVFRDCLECPEMVVIPAGQAYLASGQSVTISEPFAVGKFEITFEEWDACISGGGCARGSDDGGWGRGRLPVINVNWNDTQSYIKWISLKTGQSYRLLSGIEWEYAAQAGSAAEQSAQAGAQRANCFGCGPNWNKTAPVGSFAANDFGLHDMLGNVWEWTSECFDESGAGTPADRTSRNSVDCSRRFLRGGSWLSAPGVVRSAYRGWNFVNVRGDTFGFRVARKM